MSGWAHSSDPTSGTRQVVVLLLTGGRGQRRRSESPALALSERLGLRLEDPWEFGSVRFSQAASSSGGSGSKKRSAIVIRPLRAPNWRRPRGRYGTSLPTGLPQRAITTSSPCSTCASRRESSVFATVTLTIDTTGRVPKENILLGESNGEPAHLPSRLAPVTGGDAATLSRVAQSA